MKSYIYAVINPFLPVSAVSAQTAIRQKLAITPFCQGISMIYFELGMWQKL